MIEARAVLTLIACVTVLGWLLFASCYLLDLAGKRRRWAERRCAIEAERETMPPPWDWGEATLDAAAAAHLEERIA